MNTEVFSRLADLLPEGMLLLTVEGVIEAANGCAGELLGHRPASLIRSNLAGFVTDAPADIKAYLAACFRSSHFTPGRITLRLGDGTTLSCRTHGIRFAQRTAPSMGLVVLRLTPSEAANRFVDLNKKIEDLSKEVARRRQTESALVRQEQLLRVTLTSIGDAVITTDASGAITFLNSVAESLTGWSQAEAVGRPLDQVFVIVNEASRAPVPSPVQGVLAEGKTVGLANHTILIHRNGTERPIDDSGAPIRDEAGHLFGVVLVFHDITERRAMEREVATKADQLTEMNRRKDEFLAMLSHELRNPLAPLHNGIRVLQAEARKSDSQATPSAKNVIAMMERQLIQLTRLVNDLLDVARITRGHISLTRLPVPLAFVIERAIESVMPNVQQHKLNFEVSYPPSSVMVNADIERLSQVFTNLLSNAVKFTDPGGAIQVIGKYLDGTATIQIVDSGLGMPPELVPKVFDLFIQGDSSLARPMSGLGVGLSIVRTLVEMHGGEVTASSEGLGNGSIFSVKLPAFRKCSEEDPLSDEDATPVKNEPSNRILIVDDNADAADSMAILLRMHGHDVRTANDAGEALTLIRESKPQVLLLDIGLPGMNGYELATQLRADKLNADITLIAVTGYGQDADRERAHAVGFDYHLTKPVEEKLLFTLVNKRLAGP